MENEIRQKIDETLNRKERERKLYMKILELQDTVNLMQAELEALRTESKFWDIHAVKYRESLK